MKKQLKFLSVFGAYSILLLKISLTGAVTNIYVFFFFFHTQKQKKEFPAPAARFCLLIHRATMTDWRFSRGQWSCGPLLPEASPTAFSSLPLPFGGLGDWTFSNSLSGTLPIHFPGWRNDSGTDSHLSGQRLPSLSIGKWVHRFYFSLLSFSLSLAIFFLCC